MKKTPQQFIDELRQGDFTGIIDIRNYVDLKYLEKMNESKNKDGQKAVYEAKFGEDDIVPLMIYELYQTDLNENDIPLINYLFNEFMSNDILVSQGVCFCLSGFCMAASEALEMKANLPSELELPPLEDVYSKKEARTQFNTILESYDQARSGEKIFSQIQKEINKKSKEFLKISKNYSLAFKKMDSEINEFLLRINQREIVISTLNNYSAHLEKKKSKVESQYPKNSQYYTKFMERYNAIIPLSEKLAEREELSQEDIDAVKKAVYSCQLNKPTWDERSFLQKFSSALRLRLTPVISFFKSKESQYQQELSKVTQISKEIEFIFNPNIQKVDKKASEDATKQDGIEEDQEPTSKPDN